VGRVLWCAAMQNPWETWKKGFGAWESATAAYLEKVMDNPAVLGPAGLLLTAFMRGKAASDRALASWWGAVGLPTKRDQERTLHKLNQLESRLCDLEERLEAVSERP
jgi:hypothetical protein